jgi:hypothetical protein
MVEQQGREKKESQVSLGRREEVSPYIGEEGQPLGECNGP